MGQYFVVANLDKKQYLHPHVFNDGLKLGEFSHSSDGTMAALAFLLADNPDRYDNDDGLIGSWCGDRIAVVGDDGDSSPSYGEIQEGFENVSKRALRLASE